MTGEDISKAYASTLNLETKYTHHFLEFTSSVPA